MSGMRSEINADVTPAAPDEFDALQLGPHSVWPPVVLAPMAGVTNAPFRTICRDQGAGLYVSEMITARALVEGAEKTHQLARFDAGESPRSIQLYSTDATAMGAAVRQLVEADHVDHIDMNFGCPVPKVTRKGGGSALPYKRNLLRDIVRAAVTNAGDVPVSMKFRIGIDDDHVTYLDAGRIAEDEGCVGVALHARTAQQLYSGQARWETITRLKEHVTSIPVLGNGDIWEPWDAIRMMRETGCDGVVVGRGCLGRPWLFRDLAAVFEGKDTEEQPRFGDVRAMMVRHASLLIDWIGEKGIRDFRKHTTWYVTGYPVGPRVRNRLNKVGSLDELLDIVMELDPELHLLPDALRTVRSHGGSPRPVALPEGWLTDPDERPSVEAETLVSGG
jgi:nifR3 family TIM-barrel protein